jgi:hypothetical protein
MLPDSTIDKLNSYQDVNTKAPLPATYIFIEWKNILQKDLNMLTDRKSWNMRSKLLSATAKSKADELNNWIFDTYTQQHESYARLLSEREETEAEGEQ